MGVKVFRERAARNTQGAKATAETGGAQCFAGGVALLSFTGSQEEKKKSEWKRLNRRKSEDSTAMSKLVEPVEDALEE